MIRLVIVDDHEMVRAGIRGGLPADIEVVGEAADVQSAVSVISAQEPDVVLLDVHLPGGNAQAVLQQSSVNSRSWRCRYPMPLRTSSGGSPGRRGYVTKDITSADLATAIRQVAAGEAVSVRGWPVSCSTRSPARPPRPTTSLIALLPGSATSCALIARGYTYREAAEELFLSVKTVETHMSAVLRKLQLSNRRELARWAKGRGLE